MFWLQQDKWLHFETFREIEFRPNGPVIIAAPNNLQCAYPSHYAREIAK